MTGRRCGTLPNLLIIGAGKCGTTSLHYYLGLHPEISMSWEKELKFFNVEENWKKGVAWYASHFRGNAKIRGEATPGYTAYPRFPQVPERIAAIMPRAKLIYIVRDPIERVVSAYLTFFSEGKEHRPIVEALTLTDDNLYLCPSRYALQLERYLTCFDLSRILILTLEELRDHPGQTLRKVFRFLGVDDTFSSRRFLVIKNPSHVKRRRNRFGMMLKSIGEAGAMQRLFSVDTRRRIGSVLCWPVSSRIAPPELDEELRQRLRGYLVEDVRRLRGLTGRDFREWQGWGS